MSSSPGVEPTSHAHLRVDEPRPSTRDRSRRAERRKLFDPPTRPPPLYRVRGAVGVPPTSRSPASRATRTHPVPSALTVSLGARTRGGGEPRPRESRSHVYILDPTFEVRTSVKRKSNKTRSLVQGGTLAERRVSESKWLTFYYASLLLGKGEVDPSPGRWVGG